MRIKDDDDDTRIACVCQWPFGLGVWGSVRADPGSFNDDMEISISFAASKLSDANLKELHGEISLLTELGREEEEKSNPN